MLVRCVWEHNGSDSLLYSDNLIGAFTRGRTKEEALQKMPGEAAAYLLWLGEPVPNEIEPVLVQEKATHLAICDADSDVLFDSERAALTAEEYIRLKALALKSAADFLALFESIPDKNTSCLPERTTFYGAVPRTAEEMYAHTKNVTGYYFAEIGVQADNSGTILDCRERAFAMLEQQTEYLSNTVFTGSYDEDWSLRKVIRRFVWHDRIHAKAMYRMAAKTFGEDSVNNTFRF